MVFDKTTGSSFIEFYLPSSYSPTVMYIIMIIYPRPEVNTYAPNLRW